ncbi:L-cysteine desulfidase family protein [Anaeropeptidivorans aminofermentans]|jgi:L-cysteine desulfidase|uniref:L-cysteine desulfidase family protein n=1 Tax=Anaeropeptidivorans aminofermentans TaxID=2934315 RepID=UPI002023EF7A|nr:L-serine ammonia-lyase, iron-sulfur-dependent, subunit alpha [Anaeropeptidivorans aminofermentans]MBE6011446.1 serine dehydratase subunit alpha family protein [Lachnospiraceae bacterium]
MNISESDYKYILSVLKKELVPASGCTEPIAIAYAAATARFYLGEEPEKLTVKCSGNVIKNVKGVTVPNTGGLKGVRAAAIVGTLGGDHEKKLEVISNISDAVIKKIHELVDTDYCSVELLDTEEKLYIIVNAIKGDHICEVSIYGSHTHIVKIVKNGEILFDDESSDLKSESDTYDKNKFCLDNIIDFSDNVNLDDVKEILERQIEFNINSANEGLSNNYGITVGATLKEGATNVFELAKAYAAAASEARMGGCNLPIVTNSGSGNQGITVSVPVIIYAREKNIDKDTFYRALTLSNLMAIRIKIGIGKLSAFCGAVSAACGSAVAITYIEGGRKQQIEYTIKNMLGNVSGVVCDGAKISCALKIASALDAGAIAHKLAMKNQVLEKDTGIIKEDIEETIDGIGRLGSEGMRETDKVILDMMTAGHC